MKFLNKYNNPKNIRFKSFEKTFKICLERNHETIKGGNKDDDLRTWRKGT